MSKFVEIGLDFSEKQNKVNHEEELIKAFSFFDEGDHYHNSRRKWVYWRGRPEEDYGSLWRTP